MRVKAQEILIIAYGFIWNKVTHNVENRFTEDTNFLVNIRIRKSSILDEVI